MASREVVKAAAPDTERCVAALVMAFATDPLFRWMLPDSHRYLTSFTALTREFAATVIESESAYRSEDFAAAAFWLPPGVQPNRDATSAHLQAGIDEDRRDEVFATLQAIRASHPEETHWYLLLLGVDVSRQGMGYGSALLSRSLEAVDEAHLPAFLVSSSPRNLPLYERFGFESGGALTTGNAPPVWPMRRAAR